MEQKSKVVKSSEIIIKVGLDDKQMPVSIEWKASDDPMGAKLRPCKAMLISLFEAGDLSTAGLDLWTTDMQIIEMDRMMYQTFRRLADTYQKSTNNVELATDIQRFTQYFGEQTEILEREDGE